jgi:hypothetical protein
MKKGQANPSTLKKTWTCGLCHTLNRFWRKRCRNCGLLRNRPERGGSRYRKRLD